MVQSVNTKAILTLASIMRRPGLLVPHVSVANVTEVNVAMAAALNGLGASLPRRSTIVSSHLLVSGSCCQQKINYAALKDDAGILAVVFDKDNTLTAPYENAFHPDAAPGIAKAIQVFGKDKIGKHDDCHSTVGHENSISLQPEFSMPNDRVFESSHP